jgi:hypothetical protein
MASMAKITASSIFNGGHYTWSEDGRFVGSGATLWPIVLGEVP